MQEEGRRHADASSTAGKRELIAGRKDRSPKAPVSQGGNEGESALSRNARRPSLTRATGANGSGARHGAPQKIAAVGTSTVAHMKPTATAQEIASRRTAGTLRFTAFPGLCRNEPGPTIMASAPTRWPNRPSRR